MRDRFLDRRKIIRFCTLNISELCDQVMVKHDNNFWVSHLTAGEGWKKAFLNFLAGFPQTSQKATHF